MQKCFFDHKIKCIALDMDGTTLRSDGKLAPGTKRMLERAVNAGIEVVVVSGRAFATLPGEIIEIEGIRYAATSNGAAVYEIKSGQRLHGWMIGSEDVIKILEYTHTLFEDGQITYEVFVNGAAYAPADYVLHPAEYGIPDRAVGYIQNTRKAVNDIVQFIKCHQDELDSIDIILKDAAVYGSLARELTTSLKSIYLTSSVKYRMEISHKDAGKASGLNYILGMLGIRAEDTIAFGDGDNDADMLRFAGIGVAMKNATHLCIASADHVGGSNDEDGVAKVLEQILK